MRPADAGRTTAAGNPAQAAAWPLATDVPDTARSWSFSRGLTESPESAGERATEGPAVASRSDGVPVAVTHRSSGDEHEEPRAEVVTTSWAAGSRAPAGRHSGAPAVADDTELPLAPGLKVLLIGGAEPLGAMVAQRLMAAGHRVAVNGVTIPAELPRPHDAPPAPFRVSAPVSLAGDRADAEDVVHTVARAEVALGGLDALVVLPAHHSAGVGLDADAGVWADAWSQALTTEVLAAACATHIAARSFLARRKAGRIVLVTNGRDTTNPGALPASATRAALGRLGDDLTRELGPHGIGVSVVTTGPGGTQDFAVAQVADVVEALLSTPVLSGVSSRIG